MLGRDLRAYDRLTKIVSKKMYIKDELLNDLSIYLKLGTLSQEEYDLLLEEIANTPTAFNLSVNESGEIVSNNIYILLSKQIDKKAYTVNVIKQIITDFKITSAITSEQFESLVIKIEEKYFIKVFEENCPEEEIKQ